MIQVFREEASKALNVFLFFGGGECHLSIYYSFGSKLWILFYFVLFFIQFLFIFHFHFHFLFCEKILKCFRLISFYLQLIFLFFSLLFLFFIFHFHFHFFFGNPFTSGEDFLDLVGVATGGTTFIDIPILSLSGVCDANFRLFNSTNEYPPLFDLCTEWDISGGFVWSSLRMNPTPLDRTNTLASLFCDANVWRDSIKFAPPFVFSPLSNRSRASDLERCEISGTEDSPRDRPLFFDSVLKKK